MVITKLDSDIVVVLETSESIASLSLEVLIEISVLATLETKVFQETKGSPLRLCARLG